MRMRKYVLAAGIIGALSMGTAQADDDVGCGLGTMLWAGQEGPVPKVLAATTNGILGNQTFGITSGTLGCSRDGVITSDAVAAAYTGSNIERLALDMSQGEGESLNVMAELLGIENQDKPAFFALAKENF